MAEKKDPEADSPPRRNIKDEFKVHTHSKGHLCHRDTEPEVTEAPDGGYGWVIVFGAALTHFLLVGIGRCLGIIHVALLSEFGETETKTVWVAAIFNGCRMVAAPACALLSDCLGNRVVALAGSLLMFIGLCLSAFATSLFHLYITFGVIAGVGGAMVFTTAYIMVGTYFAKNKGKAMGFALLGCGLGNIAFAQITNLTLRTYGYWGSMLILGAIQLNHAISGALYRPLKDQVKPQSMENEFTTTTQQLDTEQAANQKVLVNKHLEHLGLHYSDQNKSLSAIPDHVKLNGSYTSLPLRQRLNTTNDSNTNSTRQLHRPTSKRALGSSFNSLVVAMSGTALHSSQTSFKSAHKVELNFLQSKRTRLDSSSLIKSQDNASNDDTDNSSTASTTCPLSCTISSDSLFFNVQFHLYAIVIMAMQIGIQGFLIFLPGFAKEYYLSDNQIAMLISIYGVMDMVGSLGFGFIIDLECVHSKRLVLHSCAGILFGVFTIFMAGMKNFGSFAIITALVGTFEGATHGQRMSILSDFVPVEKLPVAMGLVLLFQGIGNIYGPPLGGYLRDKSDTNAYNFMFCGIYMATAAVFFLTYTLTLQICRYRSKKQPV